MPEVAARAHLRWIVPALDEALETAGRRPCPTSTRSPSPTGPGLAGSLLVGINVAKTLAWAHGKPLVAGQPPRGPRLRRAGCSTRARPSARRRRSRWSRSSCPAGTRSSSRCATTSTTGCSARPSTTPRARRSTRSGGCSGLGYPGGPAISRAAETATAQDRVFPRAWMGDSYDLSFSGLKTAARRIVAAARADEGLPADERDGAPARARRRRARLGVPGLGRRRARRRRRSGRPRRSGRAGIVLGGGVAANAALRAADRRRGRGARHPGRRPATRPVHRQRGDDRRGRARGGWRPGVRAGLDLDARPSLPLAR